MKMPPQIMPELQRLAEELADLKVNAVLDAVEVSTVAILAALVRKGQLSRDDVVRISDDIVAAASIRVPESLARDHVLRVAIGLRNAFETNSTKPS